MQIYIHIPFCLSKCRYCAFNSIVADDTIIQRYVKALCNEIKQAAANQKISTIYFGGGTPSILTAVQFTNIFEALHDTFDIDDCDEITVEANPGTNLTHEYLNALQRLGVNRLSLGVQSFDDDLLRILGRIHNSNEAIEAVNLAKSIFENVSLDLMYDLPNQNLKTLKNTIATAIKLNPQHISIYGLEIEESTAFGRLNELGQLNLPNDEESDKMYEYIMNELPKHGFNRYEISNFAKASFESKHNLGYWSDVTYLGFGAGAHSYINSECGMQNSEFGLRFSNVTDVQEYIKGVDKCLEEIVNKERAMEEFCFLSLRKAEGINTERFKLKFGVSIESIYNKTIDKLSQQGLLNVTNDYIRLTERGMKYGNYAFAEFLLYP